MHVLLSILDLGGTFVFAISGAAVAVKRRMDIFGVMVLAFAAGNAGGITRDLLIGAVPPTAVSDGTYLGVSVLAGLLMFWCAGTITKWNHPVLWFDAVGLAFFAVVGTQKALLHGLDPVMAALLGMLTGIGGGMVRDILANDIPAVLRSDLYAFAALACAAIVSAGHVLHLPPITTAVVGMAICLLLRFMAIQHGWHLPVERATPGADSSPKKESEGQE